MRCPHFKGEWATNKNKNNSGETPKMYEIIAIAKRLNYSFEEMKQISFTTLMNLLLSNVKQESEEQEATQNDIDNL